MCWVQCLLDASSTQTRSASLVIPKRGNDKIHYSIRKIGTVTGLLYPVGLVKQRAFFKSENHATTELQQPGGVSSQFSTPCTTEFVYFIMLTRKEAYVY